MTPKVGIVGYRGYSGAELVRLLERHPRVGHVLLDHREDSGGGPAIRNRKLPLRLACTPEAVKAEGIALVFLATPPEVSMELAPAMLGAGARVVDLSGAFRLRTPENYAAWYKEAHTQPALLAEAAYGLPEFCRESHPRRPAGGQSGLLSDGRQPGYPSAPRGGRGGPRRRDRLRRQIRRQRRRPQAQPQDQLLRGGR